MLQRSTSIATDIASGVSSSLGNFSPFSCSLEKETFGVPKPKIALPCCKMSNTDNGNSSVTSSAGTFSGQGGRELALGSLWGAAGDR